MAAGGSSARRHHTTHAALPLSRVDALFLGVLSRSGGGLGNPADEGEPETDQHEDAEAQLHDRRHVLRGGGAFEELRRDQQRNAAQRHEPAEQRDEDRRETRPILVVRDDQQPAERHAAGDPHERSVLKESRQVPSVPEPRLLQAQ